MFHDEIQKAVVALFEDCCLSLIVIKSYAYCVQAYDCAEHGDHSTTV